ncbi:MAG: SPOR domain-containing protein [Acidobacteriia bacterium]|nr:SPOR domain-containing protein [Terriglobia bacterium]
MLEGRHVIGLFVLMLLFSGVFFTLGYVMGRNQYDGQVRAAAGPHGSAEAAVESKKDAKSKNAASEEHSAAPGDAPAAPYPEWEFYHAGEAGKSNDRLKPAESAPKSVAVSAKSSAAAKPAAAAVKRSSLNAPLIPGGATVLQVAALTKESDALELAQTLQKKKFPAFVLTPGADKYYRVQVGPYGDAQAAGAAKKGLENAGFKAIVKR